MLAAENPEGGTYVAVADGVAADERVGEAEREVVPLGDKEGKTVLVALADKVPEADTVLVGDNEVVTEEVELVVALAVTDNEAEPLAVTDMVVVGLARGEKDADTVDETVGNVELLGDGECVGLLDVVLLDVATAEHEPEIEGETVTLKLPEGDVDPEEVFVTIADEDAVAVGVIVATLEVEGNDVPLGDNVAASVELLVIVFEMLGEPEGEFVADEVDVADAVFVRGAADSDEMGESVVLLLGNGDNDITPDQEGLRLGNAEKDEVWVGAAVSDDFALGDALCVALLVGTKFAS
jgi:hypothetical protein